MLVFQGAEFDPPKNLFIQGPSRGGCGASGSLSSLSSPPFAPDHGFCKRGTLRKGMTRSEKAYIQKLHISEIVYMKNMVGPLPSI